MLHVLISVTTESVAQVKVVGVLSAMIRCLWFSFSHSKMSGCWFNDAVKDPGSFIFPPSILSMFGFHPQACLMVARRLLYSRHHILQSRRKGKEVAATSVPLMGREKTCPKALTEPSSSVSLERIVSHGHPWLQRMLENWLLHFFQTLE